MTSPDVKPAARRRLSWVRHRGDTRASVPLRGQCRCAPVRIHDSLLPGLGRCILSDTVFDDATWTILRNAAQRVARVSDPAGIGADDIEQELALRLWLVRHRHDPLRADWHAFAHSVARRAGITILRRAKAKKRDIRQAKAEGRRPVLGSACGTAEGAAVEDRELGQADMRLDLESFAATLPEPLRAVHDALRTHRPADAARLLGMPNSTLHSRIRHLRRLAEAAGIPEYLRPDVSDPAPIAN